MGNVKVVVHETTYRMAAVEMLPDGSIQMNQFQDEDIKGMNIYVYSNDLVNVGDFVIDPKSGGIVQVYNSAFSIGSQFKKIVGTSDDMINDKDSETGEGYRPQYLSYTFMKEFCASYNKTVFALDASFDGSDFEMK